MSELKICTRCKLPRDVKSGFYVCRGTRRTECKACTIKKNVSYQKKIQAWKHRFVDAAKQRSYMSDYYSKNKAKFAEYRRLFKLRYPDYYKTYNLNRKSRTEHMKVGESSPTKEGSYVQD